MRLITVHGTFKPKAPWAQPDSPFHKAIAHRLVERSVASCVNVSPVDWGGGNTFADRIAGADRLLEELAKHPADDIAIVAHSHGGSVLSYAYARRPAAFAGVKAIVCMSTPFFGLSLRPGYAALLTASVVAFVLFAFQVVLSIALLVAHDAWHGVDENTPAILAIGAAAATLAGVCGAWLFRRRKALLRSAQLRTDAAMTWDTTRIDVPGATYIRSMGDEVAFGLGTLQFACSFANAVLLLLAAVSKRTTDFIAIAWCKPVGKVALPCVGGLLILSASLPALFSTFLGSAPHYWIDLLWMWNSDYSGITDSWMVDQLIRVALQVAIVAIVALEAIAFTYFVALVAAMAASTILLRAMGAWSPVIGLAMQFAVEPTPEGSQRFVNAGWERGSDELADRPLMFQHSDPYLSRAALDVIADALIAGLRTRA